MRPLQTAAERGTQTAPDSRMFPPMKRSQSKRNDSDRNSAQVAEDLDDAAPEPRSPISRVGRSAKNRASRVAGTRCGSYGEALATWTAIGRPARSTIAMILEP